MRRKFLVVVDRDANRIRKFVTAQHQGLSPFAGGYNTSACHNESHVDGEGTAATFCRPESVTASADGSRVVVAEALLHYGTHDQWRRCRKISEILENMRGNSSTESRVWKKSC